MERDIYDLLIIGGGCAGLTAGIYGGRAGLKTAIIAKQSAGGQAAITDEIANYPGFDKINGAELAERMLAQAKGFGTQWLQADVQSVELDGRVKKLITDSGTLECHALIIATGANPKKAGFSGEEEYRGRGVGYCATCDGFFFKDKDIFVIGGGNSAAEESLYLTRFGKSIKILVRKNELSCAKAIADRVMAHPKIEVLFNTELVRAFGEETLKGLVYINNKTGEETEYRVSQEDKTFGIFVFVGYQPNSELFRDKLSLDERGYIITNELMETSIAGVYAAGDVRPKPLRQLVTASSDGAIAAAQAEKYVEGIKAGH